MSKNKRNEKLQYVIDNEIWKDLPVDPFNLSYDISNIGRIRNKKSGNIKQQQISHTGYNNVRLDSKITVNNIRAISKTFDVHRLVALAFLGNPPTNKHVVNHKDLNKTNNNLNNLEYITQKENTTHANENLPPKQNKKSEKCDLNNLETFDIPNYSKYCIDKNGNIYNKITSIKLSTFTSNSDGTGYIRICLLNDNKKNKKIYHHKLIAQVFIPNPKKLPIINHIDNNKQNNNINNLEWCTQSHNMKHNASIKKTTRKVGQYDIKSKKLINTYISIKDASNETNTLITSIIHVCAGRRQYAGGFGWKYIDGITDKNKFNSISS